MNKKQYSEFGKQGAAKRWASRYEILKELTRYYGKDHQDEFLKWPTKYLIETLKLAKKIK